MQMTPQFKAWFRDSKVVDTQGNPLPVYHGTKRPDRVGSRFRKSRATSGPMAFFTANPDIASKYATGKRDTSLEPPEDYADWFQYKPQGSRSTVNITRAWYFLPHQEREKLAQTLPHVCTDDGREKFFYDPDNWAVSSKEHWDNLIREAKGNVLRAAKDLWLDGAVIFGNEQDFMQILEIAGMDMNRVSFESPHRENPAVYKVYLSIQNPLTTSAIPQQVIDALDKASRRQRRINTPYGVDAWDKRSHDPQEWIADLKEDPAGYAWTSIPDWVTKTLVALGFDGIHDKGGKWGGETHDVWVPFEENQVKSAIGNKGTYNSRKNDIGEGLAVKVIDLCR